MKTVNVKPWGEGQGDVVTIDVADFDPSVHERLDGDDTPLPGPYDDFSRAQLVDKAVEEFKADLFSVSDDDLRAGLTQRFDARVAEARVQREASRVADIGPFNGADPKAFDHNHDGRPGGSLGADDTLLGSNIQPAHVLVGEHTVQLGGVVAAAHRESGLTVAEWNALVEWDREVRLSNTIARLASDEAAFADEVDPTSVITDQDDGGGEKAPDAPKERTLHDLTVPALKQLATDERVELGDAKKKDDIIALLVAANVPVPPAA